MIHSLNHVIAHHTIAQSYAGLAVMVPVGSDNDSSDMRVLERPFTWQLDSNGRGFGKVSSRGSLEDRVNPRARFHFSGPV